MISSLPQLFIFEVLVCWISIFFLKIGPSVTNVWYSPYSPHKSTVPSFLRSVKNCLSSCLPSHSLPRTAVFTRTTVALKPSFMNSLRTSVVSRCHSGFTGVNPTSLQTRSSHPVSCWATSNMSPVTMPCAPLALASRSALVNCCSYVSGVVGCLVIGMPRASDCASKSWVLIMWKLLLPWSCIMMRRFWIVCPCCCALYSAKQLSFPPDQDAISFMSCFFSFFVCR